MTVIIMCIEVLKCVLASKLLAYRRGVIFFRAPPFARDSRIALDTPVLQVTLLLHYIADT